MENTNEQLTSSGCIVAIILLLWLWLPSAFLVAIGFSISAVFLSGRQVIDNENKGEMSSRNGEEPNGKITHTKYSYQTPDDRDITKGISTTVTTTASVGGRRSSGPKIIEIEDVEERRSSIASETSSRQFSGTKISDFEETESTKLTKDHDSNIKRTSTTRRLSQGTDESSSNLNASNNLVSSAIKKFSDKVNDDDRIEKRSTTVSSAKFISSTSSSVRKSNLINDSGSPATDKVKSVSTARKQSTKNLETDDEKEISSSEKKTLIRGDSVRALQHKFQQATGNNRFSKEWCRGRRFYVTVQQAARRSGRNIEPCSTGYH